jgi:hypothetical protein
MALAKLMDDTAYYSELKGFLRPPGKLLYCKTLGSRSLTVPMFVPLSPQLVSSATQTRSPYCFRVHDVILLHPSGW